MAAKSQYTDSESDFNTPILKVRDVPERFWIDAVRISKRFLSEYPDRIGRHDFVIYVCEVVDPRMPSLIVYRTKTSVVVRGNGSNHGRVAS